MRILITHYCLDNFFGSEIFTWHLARELTKRKHKVVIFSPVLGKVSKEMEKEGLTVTDDLEKYRQKEFDIIHAQQNSTAIMARSLFPKTPMVFVSHSTSEILEQTPSVDLGISMFVAISEKVKESLSKNKIVKKNKIKVVKNLIDTNRFYSQKPINKQPSRLMILSNHFDIQMRKVIEKSCRDLGIKVFHVGLPENPVINVEDYINKSDIVVTLGRGALEAMACERNVIIFDRNGGDGFVNENNFYEIEKYHFSGKTYGCKYTAEEFKKEILKYDFNQGKILRKLIKKEYSLNVIINKFEKIYNEIRKEKVTFSEIRERQLYDEFLVLYNLYAQTKDRIRNNLSLKKMIRKQHNKIKMLNNKIKILEVLNKTPLGKINWATHNPMKLINKYLK